MALIKREIITNREVLHAQSVLVLRKKEGFQNSDFSRLKCQLKQKKLTQHGKSS